MARAMKGQEAFQRNQITPETDDTFPNGIKKSHGIKNCRLGLGRQLRGNAPTYLPRIFHPKRDR